MKKLTIILLAAAVALSGLSAASAAYAVRTASASIEAIGQVRYDEESRAALDEAGAAVARLDPNLNLESRVENLDELESAKAEYVRLAIKTAVVANQRRTADGITDEEIRQRIADARAAADAYIPGDELEQLPNYEDLVWIELRYAPSEESAPEKAEPESGQGTVVVPLC